MSVNFNEERWIEQELAKVTHDNVSDLYLSHVKTFRLVGGTHRDILLRRIREKFPQKFSRGSR